MKTVNVSLVGVGGQGIILTADLLAKTAAKSGLDVKKSEIHGMAQRGGSVTSQVRFGDDVASPIIQEGTADRSKPCAMWGFSPEAARLLLTIST